MAEYYVDPTLSTGDNDGTTKPNAWWTLQRAVDGTDGTKPVSGDTVPGTWEVPGTFCVRSILKNTPCNPPGGGQRWGCRLLC